MRGHDIYRQTCDGDNSCGCCAPITDQAESDDSALLIPENLTPGQRLLWEIFAKQPPETNKESKK